MSKEKSGKMNVKRFVPFLAAAVMAFAILPMLTEQVYGATEITLQWDNKEVLCNDGPCRTGYFDVEYDGNGDPFYRYGDKNYYVDKESVKNNYWTRRITVEDTGCLKGDEFKDYDQRYFGYEIIGWAREPGGEIVLKNYQKFQDVSGLLHEGLTLYPIWRQTPNITYHNTITEDVLESRGSEQINVITDPAETPLPSMQSPSDYREAAASDAIFTAPYHLISGWAESADGDVKYRGGDEIIHSDHMDLYSVWYQSRISDIPPDTVGNNNRADHFWFGGKRWRKLGASDDKALLIYDEQMTQDALAPGDAVSLYRHIIDLCITGWYDGFSSAEKAAVCSTDKNDGKTPQLTQAKLFLLCWDEAMTYFSGDADRKGQGVFSHRWFLRDVMEVKPNADCGAIGAVEADGSYTELPENIDFQYYYEHEGYKWTAGERPAFVLDRSKVLFTSSDKQDKGSVEPTDGSSFGVLSGTDEHLGVSDSMKLTLLDEAYKDFAAHVNPSNRVEATPGGTLEVSYVNAATGGNKYISALLCDSYGDVIGYASMKPSESSGTWELKLPQNLNISKEDYTLKVFNEQQNGEHCSDYASPFSVITLTKHNFTYAAKGATITATCVNTGGCQLANHCVKLTIAAPELKSYGGAGSAKATLNGLAGFNSATGKNVVEADIRYAGRDGTTYKESATAPTAAGKYTAKITVEKKTASVNYEIARISIQNAKVSGIIAKTWTGKALNQSPVVKLSGKTLKNGTNYTVVYKNNNNVGKATLTIKGKGNYTGTITKTFNINPRGTSIAKLTKAKKAFTVKWNKQTKKMSKSCVTGYQIQIATNKDFTKDKRTVTVKGYKAVSKEITKLSAKKQYYVRVRTYKTVSGEQYYSPWSKANTVTTK